MERESGLFAKYDDHDEPAKEFSARLFEGEDEAIFTFVHADQTVFVRLELASA